MLRQASPGTHGASELDNDTLNFGIIIISNVYSSVGGSDKMNLQKYTEKAQEAVLTARQFAEDASHSQIEPIHLLAALAEQPEGVVPQLLARMGVDIGALGRA